MPESLEPNEIDSPPIESLVLIDGRWAQVCTPELVKYLDDGTFAEINWEDFERVPFGEENGTPDSSVDRTFVPDLLDKQKITHAEVSRIVLGGDSFEVKSTATVHGQYRKRT